MTTTVYKFGGSSLGTIGGLARVGQLIAAACGRGDRLIVVVSALGDTTDWLIEAAHAAAAGDVPAVDAKLGQISKLGQTVAVAALENPDREVQSRSAMESVLAALAPLEQELSRVLDGVSLVRELSPRVLDHVLSFGERLSAALVAVVISDVLSNAGIHVRAVALDARDFIVTDDTPQQANVDIDATNAAVRAVWLAGSHDVAVVTGFIGRSMTGRTTTLGRNGSDYTAALLAAAIAADELTVWTDVPGVFTADPGLVAEAYPVTRLTYREALELAHFGTKMFHARTMIPLIESGIALTIRSTLDSDAPGTRIDEHGHQTGDHPTCVTSLEQLALVSVEAQRSSLPTQFLGGALTALSSAGVRVWMTNQSGLGVSASFVVPQAQQTCAHTVLEAHAAQCPGGDVLVREAHAPVSLITLVAEQMGQQPNVAGRFFSALGNIGIRVRAIAQGASERSISCVVEADDTAAAVHSVHAAFNFAEPVVHVFLLGRGTVGRSLLQQIDAQCVSLRQDHGVRLKLVGIADTAHCLFDDGGMSGADAAAVMATGVVNDALLDRLSRLSAPVLVDCTSAQGMEKLYLAAFERGIHVVAANKKALTIDYAQRQALMASARRHSRSFLYETTCGASLPVIETLKNLVRTGDVVHRIEGSLSGTLSYLADQLMQGVPLSRAVLAAQVKGLTEPHPRDDLSGLDVARKAVILARELGAPVALESVRIEPFVDDKWLQVSDPKQFITSLTAIDALFADKIAAMKREGLSLRYLAQIEPGRDGEGVGVRVGPVAVSATHPAASLRGEEAMVAFHTKRYATYPLIVRGAGAGGDVTAAGVLADVLRLASNLRGR
jgi:bifunctional aspartokinase / homoserine dehydrogenase 1